MIADFVKNAIVFVQSNWGMLPAVMAIVAFAKEKKLCVGKNLTYLALALGILFGAAEGWLVFGSFEGLEFEQWFSIIVNGVSVGGMASGLYKVGRFVTKQPQ